MKKYSSRGIREGSRPTALEWSEALGGIVLGFIVWAVTKEVLSFTITAVGVYAALLSGIIRQRMEVLRDQVRQVGEEASQLATANLQLLRERELEYVRSFAKYQTGRYEVLEKEAVTLMRHYAETFRSRMIATSYYDLAAWTASATQDSFWSVYDRRARASLQRIKAELRNGFIGEEQLNEYLTQHPIITRVFVIEQAKWNECKKIIEAQMGEPGCQILCVLKEDVITIGWADESENRRVENLHDFVVFDEKIVIEIFQERSEWPGNPLNTQGLVFTPTLERGDYWIDRFGRYFVNVLNESCTYADMNQKLIAR